VCVDVRTRGFVCVCVLPRSGTLVAPCPSSPEIRTHAAPVLPLNNLRPSLGPP
jgi:hypothetical protein